MPVFTGQYERTIDAKHRIQLSSQLRAELDSELDGRKLFVTLGEFPGTLSIFTPQGFTALAARMQTEYTASPAARKFELQFYGIASTVDMDKQGRIVLPERLIRKARLGEEIYLLGQRNRIEIWGRSELDRAMGIDWEGDDWPDWPGFLRRKPDQAD